MKKLLLLALTAVIMAGCGRETETQNTPREKAKAALKKRLNGFSIVVVDNCEYIIRREENSALGYQGYGYGFLAHKGNCRFCKERMKKELEELVIKLKEK